MSPGLLCALLLARPYAGVDAAESLPEPGVELALELAIDEPEGLRAMIWAPDSRSLWVTGAKGLYRIDGEKLLGHWSAPLAAGQVFEETLTRVAHPPAGAPSTPQSPPQQRPSGGHPFGPGRTI